MPLKDLLHRAARRLAPVSRPHVVQGTRPGYVWCPAEARWVDEDESYRPTGRTYALIGPVHSGAHGQP